MKLWRFRNKFGHPALLASPDMQQNYKNLSLDLFTAWRAHTWRVEAQAQYVEFDCGSREQVSNLLSPAVTLTMHERWKLSCREMPHVLLFVAIELLGPMDLVSFGDWKSRELHSIFHLGTSQDGWFNSWFQTLRTAYGMYVAGKRDKDARLQQQAGHTQFVSNTQLCTHNSWCIESGACCATSQFVDYIDSSALWCISEYFLARRRQIAELGRRFGVFTSILQTNLSPCLVCSVGQDYVEHSQSLPRMTWAAQLSKFYIYSRMTQRLHVVLSHFRCCLDWILVA